MAHFLEKENPDFLLITEHGLSQENLKNTCIEGYSLIGGFSRKAHIKGGVAGYARKNMMKQVKFLGISQENTELVCEVAAFEIKLKKENIQVLGVYRPPNAALEDAIDILTEQLNMFLQTNKQTIIMGDINVDNMVENSNNSKLEELLATYSIARLKLPPTRVTNETSKSIDWICTNINPDRLKTIVTTSGLSDHTAQIAEIKTHKISPKSSKEEKRLFTKKETDLFKAKLQTQNWDSTTHTDEANQAYNNFHNTIQAILNKTCPLRTVNCSRVLKKGCWDDECRILKNAYIIALEKEQRTGLAEDKAALAARKKDYDQKLKRLRKEQTAAHINQAANKSKALWQVINNERNAVTNKNHELTLLINDQLTHNPIQIANHFNEFFATIADKTIQNSNTILHATNVNRIQTLNNKLHFHPATHVEVIKAIDSLKPKTSSGIDDISAKLIKKCKEELVSPLTNVINKSLKQGIFPTQLKTSKVYPKYKKGPKTETISYRPISLISTFSKIFEKIILERLTTHLETHRLLTNQQHGFLKGRSTATAIIQLIEHIIDQLEDGCIVNSLFLDFSKAFDCLNHEHLLKKLRNLGVGVREEEWFRSYLKDRKQLVEITHTKNNIKQKIYSEKWDIKRGVPQGSVLGPVLFLLLTNDLPDWLQNSCQTVMYADDTVITLSDRNADTLKISTTSHFNQTKQYCSQNDLVLNENKTVQIAFTTKNKNQQVHPLPGLEVSTTTKYLGITIDSSLSWNPHLKQLCKRLSSSIHVIRRIHHIGGLDVAKVAYFALFESHLRYGIATWGGAADTNLKKVLVQQKRAVRCLASIPREDSCKEHFKDLKILTVVSLYIRETIMHAVNTQQLRHHSVHQHNTRHASDFSLAPHHLSLFKMKPSYKGALLFNHLPEYLKAQEPQHLKRQLTLWLQERPFYTENEFLRNRTT